MIVRILLAALALVLWCPGAGMAQTPTSYEFHVFTPGVATPISRTPFAVAEVTCNQPMPASTASTVNPNSVVWEDPSNAGRACIWLPNVLPGGVLVSLPTGGYEGAVVAIDAAGPGALSNKAAFSRQPLQPARAGVRVIRTP